MIQFFKEYPIVPFLLFAVFLVLKARFHADPRQVLKGHLIFVFGTLGASKTSLVSYLGQLYIRRPGGVPGLLRRLMGVPWNPPPVYATYKLEGARPLDVGGQWPTEPGAIIIWDEILALEMAGLLRDDWFSRGIVFARQMGQHVFILSQDSRIEGRFKRFNRVMQLHVHLKSYAVPWGGRLSIAKVSTVAMRMGARGFSAYGSKLFFFLIPNWVYSTYQSNRIFGYTIDLDGNWLDVGFGKNAVEMDQIRAAAARRPAQRAPRAGGREAEGLRRPAWFKPGGKRAS